MTPQWTEEQQAFQKSFQKFLDEQITPLAAQVDQRAAFSKENWRKLAEVGFFALFFEKELEGQGADEVTRTLALELLAGACASTALSASASTTLCGGTIARSGSKEQKEAWIPRFVRGECVGAFGLTEPGCGSDVRGMQTRAERSEKGYTLQGSKMFITNGNIADVSVVFARTARGRGRERGDFSAFLVPRETAGFRAGEPLKKMGVRGSPTTELFFQDCSVGEETLLGREGDGFAIAMETLEVGRVGMAAWCLGIGGRALKEALRYAKERTAFGRPIAHFQGIHFKLAEMHMEYEAAKLLTYRAAWKREQGESAAEEASQAKLFASEMAMRVTHAAVQVHGGYGYIQEFPVERCFRDARLGEIGEGSSEIQRLIIARHLLKEDL